MFMNKTFYFSLISIMLIGYLPGNVNAQTGKGRQLHIIYIDNSERGGANSGLSGSMMDYIFTKVLDSINLKDKNISYLLYISNGNKPFYSRTPDKFGDLTNKLTERKLKYPSSLEDKMQMRDVLYKDKLSGFEKITIDFYVTNYYLNQELLSDYPGYLLNFFPKELQYVTNCVEDNITVNIYYPDNAGKEKNIQKKLFLNNARFASNIKYNFFIK